MTQEELDKIVEQHQHWLQEDCEGFEGMKANLRGANLSLADLRGSNLSRADLSAADLRDSKLRQANLCMADLRGANLYGSNLRGADLSGSNLRGADLRGADLSGSNLRGADLSGADLYWANLSLADLSGVNLYGANLYGSNLSEANLRLADLSGSNLRGADLSEANLYRANLREEDQFRLGNVLTEPLKGYKKTKEGVVITAEIPAGAIVFCINGIKCRTNLAKITDMDGREILHSSYDNSFEYRLGQVIKIKDFNMMYNVECASGFHFFRTREEAEEY